MRSCRSMPASSLLSSSKLRKKKKQSSRARCTFVWCTRGARTAARCSFKDAINVFDANNKWHLVRNVLVDTGTLFTCIFIDCVLQVVVRSHRWLLILLHHNITNQCILSIHGLVRIEHILRQDIVNRFNNGVFTHAKWALLLINTWLV